MKTPFLALAGAAAISVASLILFQGQEANAQDDKRGPIGTIVLSAKTTQEYIVVSAGSPEQLQEEIVKRMSTGRYNLAGGVSVVFSNQQTWYHQAISTFTTQ